MHSLKYMFLTLVCALVFGAAPSLASSASADEITDLTCGELTDMGNQEATAVIIWMDGFYTGRSGSEDFSPETWGDLADLVGLLCEDEPDRKVLRAIDDVVRTMSDLQNSSSI